MKKSSYPNYASPEVQSIELSFQQAVLNVVSQTGIADYSLDEAEDF
ncbi:MAG: hypothetical protein ACI39U_07015 [Candidatus Cryptobacteroides sp.]